MSPNGQKGLSDRTERITVFSFIIVACPGPERRDTGVKNVRWHFPRVTANEQTADGSFRVAEDGANGGPSSSLKSTSALPAVRCLH